MSSTDQGSLKGRETGSLDPGPGSGKPKGRGRGRGFQFKNRQKDSQGVGFKSEFETAPANSQNHTQIGQLKFDNENNTIGFGSSLDPRVTNNDFHHVGNEVHRTGRIDHNKDEINCSYGGAKPKQNCDIQKTQNSVVGPGNSAIRGKGFGTPTSPKTQSLHKTTDEAFDYFRGRCYNRDGEFDHERDASPDRTGFQHRGDHAHQSRSLQRDTDHDRESSPDRQGFFDEEPSNVFNPIHSKDNIGYKSPSDVQNDSKANRSKRDRSDERQKGTRNNRNDKEKENWGGNRRRSGNEWSSPKSDASQSPMSETSSPRPKKYRDKNPMVHLSKTLSFILRHGAERKGFKLMPGGYLYVDDILHLPELQEFTEKDVETVVQNNDKQRFALETEEGTGRLKIRANQGHSVQVEGLELTPILAHSEIPVVVHGTYMQTWNIIKKEGLSRMNRNHIHFAPGEPQDNGVISGMRASCEVMIFLDAEKALNEGLKFYRSANNVILSPGDPDGYIHPRYFSTVIQRVPRDVLEFDTDIQTSPRKIQDPVGPTIPGLPMSIDTSARRKRKGKRRGKGGHNENDNVQGAEEIAKKMDDSVTKDDDNQPNKEDTGCLNIDWNLREALGEDIDIKENMPPDSWDEDEQFEDAKESLSQTDSSHSVDNYDTADSSAGKGATGQHSVKLKYQKIDSIESSVKAVDILSDAKQKCVAVYCHVLASDNHEDITDILIGTDDIVYHFDLTSELSIMEEGKLAEFFFTKQPVKIFYGISNPSAILFEKYHIVLDGTDVFDTKIGMELTEQLGQGNIGQLAAFGFTPDRMDSNVEGSLDDKKIEKIKEKCYSMLHSYDLFDGWLEKKVYKKHVYQAVNEGIAPGKLKEVKNERKKKAKSASSCTEQNQQLLNAGKKKSKGKKK